MIIGIFGALVVGFINGRSIESVFVAAGAGATGIPLSLWIGSFFFDLHLTTAWIIGLALAGAVRSAAGSGSKKIMAL